MAFGYGYFPLFLPFGRCRRSIAWLNCRVAYQRTRMRLMRLRWGVEKLIEQMRNFDDAIAIAGVEFLDEE